MKRKLISLLMTMLLIATLFTACGKEEPKDDKKSTTTDKTDKDKIDNDKPDDKSNGNVTSDPVTLNVWESTGGPDEFIKQAGEAFSAKYPNITIEYVNVELGDSSTQIALDGPAGVGPDLFAAPHDKLGELMTGGHVLPTANVDAVKENALGATIDALTYDGTMYG